MEYSEILAFVLDGVFPVTGEAPDGAHPCQLDA